MRDAPTCSSFEGAGGEAGLASSCRFMLLAARTTMKVEHIPPHNELFEFVEHSSSFLEVCEYASGRVLFVLAQYVAQPFGEITNIRHGAAAQREITVPTCSPNMARRRLSGCHRLRTMMGMSFSMQSEMAVLSRAFSRLLRASM